MATAELAAALPALVAVLLLGAGLLGAASAGLRCADAARLAARSVARGDPAGTPESLARRAAPAGAQVVVTTTGADAGGGLDRVRVTARVRLPGPLGDLLPSWSVAGTATALDESG